MKRLSLTLCTLVLAASPTSFALADILTLDFSFTSSGSSGSGTLTATSDGVNTFLIDAISGSTSTTAGGKLVGITALLPPDSFPPGNPPNDNLLFFSGATGKYSLDYNGFSYELNNGADVNLFDSNSVGFVLLQPKRGAQVDYMADITITPQASPVPEPASLILLGTGVIGLLGTVRRRLAV